MTRTQAYRVLGLTEDADRAEIKSRYRQLMHKLHPDSRSEEKENYPYSAREINEAYGILVKGKGAKDSFIRRTKESTTSKAEWEAKRQHRQKRTGMHRKILMHTVYEIFINMSKMRTEQS